MCLTTVIQAPGANERGLGAAGQVALRADCGDCLNSSSRPLFVRRRATREAFARNWTSIVDPSQPKLRLGAQGAPNGPTASQGSQREAKATPRRAPWEPKAPQRLPKGSPKSRQGKKNELQRPPKETNKSQNYIHINKIHANSRPAAIWWPTSTI